MADTIAIPSKSMIRRIFADNAELPADTATTHYEFFNWGQNPERKYPNLGQIFGGQWPNLVCHEAQTSGLSIVEQLEERMRRLDLARIPKEIAAVAYTPERRAVLGFVRQHIAHRGITILVGETRSGKSVAAACWLVEGDPMDRRIEHLPGVWISGQELGQIAPWNAESWERLNKCRRLVIDDLRFACDVGAENESRKQIEALLIRRHDRRFPTLLTDNLLPREFVSRWDSAVASRFDQRFLHVSKAETRSLKIEPGY